MQDKEFNLLDEPWILVMTMDGLVVEKALPDVLIHAHEYRRLSGELPAQDFAILRLLLAVMQTVVYRYDSTGSEMPLIDVVEAFERWSDIWNAGCLPKNAIREYLEEWRDRFWLFHPTRPFYQVPEAALGTENTAAKLNGAISESNNKARWFSERSGDFKSQLSYSEAVRWLIYLNGFDDNSAKPKSKNLPTVGAGWLGKMGCVFAEGENLFETIMLNLVLTDGNEDCWKAAKPIWELAEARSSERVEIVVPDNQAELLTLQSRRILLTRENDIVTGYKLLGGDFFPLSNALNEQMTFWKVKKEKNKAPEIIPRRNTPNKQLWRDFANLVIPSDDCKRPGVVGWVEKLKKHHLVGKKRIICFRIVSVQYGDSDYFVKDEFGDSIEFCMSIFSDIGQMWTGLVQKEILISDIAAEALRDLERNLYRSAGIDKTELRADEEFYYRLDVPFRKWLLEIDPEGDATPDEMREKWRQVALPIALECGKEMYRKAGLPAFVGRNYKDKNENNRYYAAPDAFNRFNKQIYGCYKVK